MLCALEARGAKLSAYDIRLGNWERSFFAEQLFTPERALYLENSARLKCIAPNNLHLISLLIRKVSYNRIKRYFKGTENAKLWNSTHFQATLTENIAKKIK